VSLLAIALKDLRLIARDRAALLFTLIVPIIVITIVAGTLGGHGGGSILLPVVNDDGGPVAEALTQTLGKHVEVVEVDRVRAEALVGVEKRAAAALVLPERLSKRYLGGLPSTLTLLTDPAKGTEVNTLKAYLMLADREAAALADPLSEKLLLVDEHNLTGSRLTTSSFEQNVPGFSVMFVLMSLLFGVAFGLRDEHDWGTITRLRMAPIGRAAVLGGKLLARYVVGVTQMLILFAFGHIVFGVSLGRSVLVFVTLTSLVVFSMTGFSLLVASFARTREQIIPLGLTVVMLVCAIGGCWWPLFMEPRWLQRVAHATPTAWAMDGLSDLILRDRTLVEIGPTLGVLFAYGLACLVAGAWLYRLTDGPRGTS
jgi:linearmycin/streptolysin S transport system permease protein